MSYFYRKRNLSSSSSGGEPKIMVSGREKNSDISRNDSLSFTQKWWQMHQQQQQQQQKQQHQQQHQQQQKQQRRVNINSKSRLLPGLILFICSIVLLLINDNDINNIYEDYRKFSPFSSLRSSLRRKLICKTVYVRVGHVVDVMPEITKPVDRSTPAHVDLCSVLLELDKDKDEDVDNGFNIDGFIGTTTMDVKNENMMFQEDPATCLDWSAPLHSFLEIYASTLIASLINLKAGRELVSYSHNCRRYLEASHDPPNVDFDFSTTQTILPSANTLIDPNDLLKVDMDGVKDLCRGCLAHANAPTSLGSYSAGSHHCLLYPGKAWWSSSSLQSERNLQTETDGHAMIDLTHLPIAAILPSITSRVEHMATDWMYVSEPIDKERESGAIVIVDEYSIMMNYGLYSDAIPFSTTSIQILATASCAHAAAPLDSTNSCIEHGRRLKRFFMQTRGLNDAVYVRYDVIASTASILARAAHAKTLVCSPGTITCIIPALGKMEGTKAVLAQASSVKTGYDWIEPLMQYDSRLADKIELLYLETESNNMEMNLDVIGEITRSGADGSTVDADPDRAYVNGHLSPAADTVDVVGMTSEIDEEQAMIELVEKGKISTTGATTTLTLFGANPSESFHVDEEGVEDMNRMWLSAQKTDGSDNKYDVESFNLEEGKEEGGGFYEEDEGIMEEEAAPSNIVGKKGEKDGTDLTMEHAMVMQGPNFFNDNNDGVEGKDMIITSHNNDGVKGIDMGITVKDSTAKENDGVDSLDMGISVSDQYAPTGKKSGGFDRVIGAPNEKNKDPTSSNNDPFGIGISLKKKSGAKVKKSGVKVRPKWNFSHAATKIKPQKDNVFIPQDEDKTIIADIGDISITKPFAPIKENQKLATISNEIEEAHMVDNSNAVLGLESSMNDIENGDEDIAVDYQEKDEDQENNYADTKNVNAQEKDYSQNDVNTLKTAELDGDTKLGKVSLDGVGNSFGGAGERFGVASDFIEGVISDENDTEPIAPIEEKQKVAIIPNETEEAHMADKNNVILGLESPMNGDEVITVDYQEEDEDQENNSADTENVNLEEKGDSQNDANTLESAEVDEDTKLGEVSLDKLEDSFGGANGFKDRVVSEEHE